MFRNLRKEKELIDRELAIFREEAKLKIDQQILDYKERLIEMAKQCHDEMGEFEHDYHSTKELRGIELAKLDAQVQDLEIQIELITQQKEIILESAKAYDVLLEQKDAEIERLNDLLELMIENMPSLENLAITNR